MAPISRVTSEEKAEVGREWKQTSDILFELMRVEELLRSNIQPGDTFFWSAIIEILILLRDLSVRARKMDATHLAWSDDIEPVPSLYSDIFELIKFCRDGLCHTHTFHPTLDERNNRLARGVAGGKGVMMASEDGSLSLSCDYDDDLAIYVGAHRLYWKRHIDRLWRELRQIFIDAGKLEASSDGRLYPKPPSLPSHRSTTE